MKVRFTVLGEPIAKGRPRMTRTGRPYTPAKTVNYENLVKVEYRRQCGDFMFEQGVPLDVRITAYYSIPKSISKKKRQGMIDHTIRPTKRPDSDNICKAICDSINGIAYHDDSQIVDCQIRKFYDERPRVVVTIQPAAGF